MRCQVGDAAHNNAITGGAVLFDHRNSDNLVPRLKGKITSGTILVGGEAVSAELEMTMDLTMGGKKALGMTR